MYNTSVVLPEFSAERVTLEVLDHLERRRADIAGDRALVDKEVTEALALVEKNYRDAELPIVSLEGLKKEISAFVPSAWQAIAKPYSDKESREFGLWRGGDPVARLVYVFIGLVIGGLCVEAPFIPIWEKWFPFALAALSWWLPDAQVTWQKRRYARALGGIVNRVGQLQKQLEGMVSTEELLLPPKGESP